MPKFQVSTIPLSLRGDTKTGASFMMLGNELEIKTLQEILNVDLSEYCFDWILIYELKGGD